MYYPVEGQGFLHVVLFNIKMSRMHKSPCNEMHYDNIMPVLKAQTVDFVLKWVALVKSKFSYEMKWYLNLKKESAEHEVCWNHDLWNFPYNPFCHSPHIRYLSKKRAYSNCTENP